MRRSVRRRVIVGSVISALLLGSAIGVATAGNFVEETGSDFDCDGVRDTVVTTEWETVSGHEEAGSVTVTYSKTGASQKITQETPGVPGVAEQADHFGHDYTTYDSDSDGCDDLVIAAPHEDVGSVQNAGAVWVVPGSSTGLDTWRSKVYSQNTRGFPGVPEKSDEFGFQVDGGTTDAGVPFLLITSDGENQFSGAVHYVRPDVVAILTQNSPGVPGTAEAWDGFGTSLAVSGKHFVIGTQSEGVSGRGAAGMIHVFSHKLTSGRPTPLTGVTQNTAGVSGTAESDDRFGNALSVVAYRPSADVAAGSLVAVGVLGEDVGSVRDAGMAHLLFVSASGSVRQLAAVTQNTAGVTGGPEFQDHLGWDVVVANLEAGSEVATPDSAVWAVTVWGEDTASGERGAAHVFRPGWQRGDRDIWLEDGRFGLPQDALYNVSILRASSSSLHVGDGETDCHAVPWKNILAGADHPVTLREDSCL